MMLFDIELDLLGQKDYAEEMELETRSVCAGEMENFILWICLIKMWHY